MARRRRTGLTCLKDYGLGARVSNYVVGHGKEAWPATLNLVSDHNAPIGKPVPTPDVLKYRPLKPPGR